MSKRAEELAKQLYPESDGPMERSIFEDRRVTLACRRACENGYEQAEKEIISLIESRISEILGDAQPNPVLRIELQGIIDKIKNCI